MYICAYACQDVDSIDSCITLPGFYGLRQVHDGHGRSVQDPELHRRAVDVPELSHLVGQIIRVHEAYGSRKGETTVMALHTLGPETSDDGWRLEIDDDPVAGIRPSDGGAPAPAHSGIKPDVGLVVTVLGAGDDDALRE